MLQVLVKAKAPTINGLKISEFEIGICKVGTITEREQPCQMINQPECYANTDDMKMMLMHRLDVSLGLKHQRCYNRILLDKDVEDQRLPGEPVLPIPKVQ